jgi:2,3-bisphosphoglycerate-dependent phosphoglycerate mutase
VLPTAAGLEENERPLSPAGHEQARRLAHRLAAEPVVAVYSSPYPRARQTVEPLARMLGLDVVIHEDLRERLLSDRWLPDWRAHVESSWSDFDYRLSGGESSSEAQERVLRVLAELERQHDGQTVVAGSHGMLIARALHRLRPGQVDLAFWESMPMPALFEVAGPFSAAAGSGA